MKKLPIICLAVLSLAGCTTQVPPASVGIKFNATSGLQETLIQPQVIWVGPRDQLIVYPTSIRNATYTRNANEGERYGDDSIQASTSEGSILPVDVTVAYHVQPENALKAFQNFGTADLKTIQSTYIRSVTNYGVNVVSGSKSIFDLTSKDRAVFGREVKDVVAPILDDWGITVDDVYIGEVYPNEQVKEKVDERIATRNQLELSKVALQKAKIDSETILTNAKSQADISAMLSQQGDKVVQLKRLELQKMAMKSGMGMPRLLGNPRFLLPTLRSNSLGSSAS